MQRLTKTIFPVALAVIALALTLASTAGADAPSRVSYRGLRLSVPSGWRVYDLSRDPRTCVRFDRHAIYLGNPGRSQVCPAGGIGRTEAILVQPLAPVAIPASATSASFRTGSVLVTATWNRHKGVLERILRRSLRGSEPRPLARTARIAHVTQPASTIYTGSAFDACKLPSASTLQAWSSSPYRAFGLYIGGEAAACPAAVTPAWSASVAAAGWRLIPTYVGLQAPVNSCGCTAMSTNTTTAASQGASDAQTAVSEMQADGLGAGNPVYNDIEAYTRSASTSAAVLAYLQGWTEALHSLGYLSGAYVAAGSGVLDLVSQVGTGYVEPDDLWIASWNGTPQITDPSGSAAAWSNHQLIHQYRGAHNETYGNVTLNIDSDYSDAATATAGAVPVVPTLQLSTGSVGAVVATPGWTGPTPVADWRLLGGFTASALAPVAQVTAGGSTSKITTHSSFPYYAVEALDGAGNVLGTSASVSAPARVIVYGKSAYVPLNGLGGLPTGCATGAPCSLSLTLWDGRTRVATPGPQRIGSQKSAILWFTLTGRGRTLLARSGGRLPVNAVVRDASGVRTISPITLNEFQTSGPGVKRTYAPGQAVRLVGGTAFVGGGGFGGVLASCSGLAPCLIQTQLTVRGRQIAATGPESVGANELGYLFFKLNALGRRLLASSHGNQLGARVTLVNQVPPLSAGYGIADSAGGYIALVHAP